MRGLLLCRSLIGVVQAHFSAAISSMAFFSVFPGRVQCFAVEVQGEKEKSNQDGGEYNQKPDIYMLVFTVNVRKGNGCRSLS